MHHGHAVIGQQALDGLEIGQEVGGAHMLEHADGHDPVIGPLHIAIIGQGEARLLLQAGGLGPFIGQGQLFGRQGHAMHIGAIAAGQLQPHAAPAAADIQHPVTGANAQLLGDVHLLGLLRLLQAHTGPREIGAGVLHVLIEEPAVQVVGQVVVVADIAPRGAPVVDLAEDVQGVLDRPGEAAGAALMQKDIAADHVEQVGDIALLQHDALLHIGFAQGQVGIEQKLDGPALGDADRHLRTGSVAKGARQPVLAAHDETPDRHQPAQHGVQHSNPSSS